MPTKIPYENSSIETLQSHLKEVKNLLHLVRNMQKPDNFTYVDISNLHTQLNVLKESIEEQLKERQNVQP